MGAGHAVDPSELRAAGDPWVLDLTQRMERLAQALRQRGEAGLRTDPEMDRFDATLRAYCVGYLAGRRAGEDA
jgi:predicted component of type VI protein secretion system